MLKGIETTTLIAALIFVAGLFALMFFYASPSPPTESPQQQHSEKNEPKKGSGETDKSIWEKTTTDPVAFFTMFLVFFTAVLSGVAVIQLKLLGRAETVAEKTATAAKQSADVARDAVQLGAQTAERQLRAYVMVEAKKIVGTLDPSGLIKIPITITNIGQTPVHDMTHISGINILPYPFAGVTYQSREQAEKDFGIRKVVFGKSLAIEKPAGRPFDATEIAEATNGTSWRLYLHGRIYYRDIFKIDRHTDFCFMYYGQSIGTMDPEYCESGNTAE